MDSMTNQDAPTLIVCPRERYEEGFRSIQFRDSPIIVFAWKNENVYPYTDSIHPLVWCNKEESKDKGYMWCSFCHLKLDIVTGYYICEGIDQRISAGFKIGIHKQCIEPMENNSYHPKHSLQILIFVNLIPNQVCYCCNRWKQSFHHCSICNFSICCECATRPLLLTIHNKKMHEHTLSYIPREASMICDVCALDERRYFIYICHQCDFVVHKECIYPPWVIKISRHEHRLSFTYSFVPRKLFCGICREKVDENYGGYSCVKSCSTVFHSKCATRYDVWDKKELEGEPEEAYEDITPFKEIGNGIIQHFSHNHQMRLHEEIEKTNGDNKLCQACVFPVYDGNIFSCMECDFVLHKVCANLPLKKQHMMHPHPLVLKTSLWFHCSACDRVCNGFGYKCERNCSFILDIHCVSISEPLDHQSHTHPMFLSSKPVQLRKCSICQIYFDEHLVCGECNFTLCFRCATLPKKFMHELYDEHSLVFTFEQNASGYYWCDFCEKETYLKDGFYRCNDCDVTLHTKCLLGGDIYMLPGKIIGSFGKGFLNNHLTRHICKRCHNRCHQNKIFYKGELDNEIYCSMLCLDPRPYLYY